MLVHDGNGRREVVVEVEHLDFEGVEGSGAELSAVDAEVFEEPEPDEAETDRLVGVNGGEIGGIDEDRRGQFPLHHFTSSFQ